MAVFPGLQALADPLAEAKCVWVAFSGGLDSTVLLYQAAQLGLANLRAIHVNHQISANAAQWQQHCEDTALKLGVPLTVELVTVEPGGRGLEESARKARYAVFERVLKPGDIMLTGHHANDQAETLVYRLMRGSGLKGLCGVPATRNLGRRKRVLRPFLDVSRHQLEVWARQQSLNWVLDESNDDTSLDRNYIRHHVMPALLDRWPKAVARIATSASLLAESQQLLDAYLEEDLNACKERKERIGVSITLNIFLNFSEPRQNHVLRHWIGSHDILLPNQQHLQQIQQLLQAAPDATPEVSWGPLGRHAGGGSMYRYQNRLYLSPRLDLTLDAGLESVAWDGVSKLALGHFSLEGRAAQVGLAPGEYLVTFREGGERCHPLERQNSQTLKKLLQEYRLEPWLRNCVPLVYAGDQLVAVGDLWICQGYDTPGGYQPVWRIE